MGAPYLAHAQAPRPAGKIGYLHSRTIASNHPTLLVLRPEWQRLGYVEGETVLLRSAEGDPRRLPELVEELIALKVGVIIVVGAEGVAAASRTTKTTPIVTIEPVPRDRADELMREWSAAIYAQIKPWARGRHVKTPAHNER